MAASSSGAGSIGPSSGGWSPATIPSSPSGDATRPVGRSPMSAPTMSKRRPNSSAGPRREATAGLPMWDRPRARNLRSTAGAASMPPSMAPICYCISHRRGIGDRHVQGIRASGATAVFFTELADAIVVEAAARAADARRAGRPFRRRPRQPHPAHSERYQVHHLFHSFHSARGDGAARHGDAGRTDRDRRQGAIRSCSPATPSKGKPSAQ